MKAATAVSLARKTSLLTNPGTVISKAAAILAECIGDLALTAGPLLADRTGVSPR
jgi:hypothetical protein